MPLDETSVLLPMQPPKYPERHFVRAGECGTQPLDDLLVWVRGGTFHPYSTPVLDRGPIADQLERVHAYPPRFELKGELDAGDRRLSWSLAYQQVGDLDNYGHTFPHMTPEDAAYAALSMIEEREREEWEAQTLVGLA